MDYKDMGGGWVKVYRNFTAWEWYGDVNVSRVFFHLLLTVNYKDSRWKGKVIKPGQKVTSLQHLAEETGLSLQAVRTAIAKLKSTGEITCQSTNRNTVISIVNWQKYQDESLPANTQINSQTTNRQQAINRQSTTNKEDKKDKNEKNTDISSGEDMQNRPALTGKHRYGEHHNVLLTDDEVEKLKAKFGTAYQGFLDRFSNGLALKGYRYKSHYLAMLKWFENEVPPQPADDLIMQGMNIVPVFGGGG